MIDRALNNYNISNVITITSSVNLAIGVNLIEIIYPIEKTEWVKCIVYFVSLRRYM